MTIGRPPAIPDPGTDGRRRGRTGGEDYSGGSAETPTSQIWPCNSAA